MNELTTPSQSALLAIDDKQLEALGLSLADGPDIANLAQSLDIHSRDQLSRFGQDAAQKSAGFADHLLSQVRAGDVEGLGGKLTKIVTQAQSLNLHALGEKRSRLPLIGGLIDRMRQGKDELVTQFSSVQTNIERLMGEVMGMQRSLQSRIESLDQGFVAVKGEYRELGLHIAAGLVALARIRTEVTQGQAKAASGQLSPL